MNENLKRVKRLILIVLTCLPLVLSAQGGGSDPGDDVNDNDVPIDGGVSLLVAAGIGYGVKKIRDQRKKEKQ